MGVHPTKTLTAYYWCRTQESNPQPSHYKSAALPIELARQILMFLFATIFPRSYNGPGNSKVIPESGELFTPRSGVFVCPLHLLKSFGPSKHVAVFKNIVVV